MIVADSVTTLPVTARGSALLSGSHGGTYAAYLAARAGVRAVILNDAGVGRDQAGIGGLALLDTIGTAAATISHQSARIGDGEDGRRRGIISYVNQRAAALGIEQGMRAADALVLMHERALPASGELEVQKEHRFELAGEPGRPGIVVVDSASLVEFADTGQLVVTGSHGGLPGGDPERALKAAALAAVFNDAGVGMDKAGIGRLAALDTRGMAAATVSADSAHIGDGHSTLSHGIVSHTNATARQCGGRVGMTAHDFLRAIAASTTGAGWPP
jgi:uncharacterized protein YunC (DUF1805 family)